MGSTPDANLASDNERAGGQLAALAQPTLIPALLISERRDRIEANAIEIDTAQRSPRRRRRVEAQAARLRAPRGSRRASFIPRAAARTSVVTRGNSRARQHSQRRYDGSSAVQGALGKHSDMIETVQRVA